MVKKIIHTKIASISNEEKNITLDIEGIKKTKQILLHSKMQPKCGHFFYLQEMFLVNKITKVDLLTTLKHQNKNFRIVKHIFYKCYQIQVGEGNGTPLQDSCLENPMDGGAWQAAIHGVAKSQTRLRDSNFTFYFHALEKEMATHSSVLAWRIPGTGEPGGLPSMGLHRVRHD